MTETLALGATAGTRTERCELYERFFNQFVVYKTYCCGKEGHFPRRHFLDVVNQQLGVHLFDLFAEELDFHVQDLFVTMRGPSENETNQGNSSPLTSQRRKKTVLVRCWRW